MGVDRTAKARCCIAAGLAGVMALLTLYPSTANAADAQAGWQIRFMKDSFSDQLLAIGVVEEAEEMIAATVMVSCGPDNKLVASFKERGFSMGGSVNADFKAGDKPSSFAFAEGTVPGVGGRAILDSSRSAELMKLFESGSTVAYRHKDEQGVFSSTGAKETFEILRRSCAGDV